MEKYVLIHGGFDSTEAKEDMEIFYASDNYQGIITLTIPKLGAFDYGYYIDGGLFVVSGGIDIDSGVATDNILYINASNLFAINLMVESPDSYLG